MLRAAPGSRLLANCLVAASMLIPLAASAAPPPARPVIPPGREALISELVQSSFEAAGIEDAASIRVERDRIRIAPASEASARLVVLPPGAERDEAGDEPAPGVIVQCGRPTSERCPTDELARWTPVARELARARDPRATEIWIAAQRAEAPPEDPAEHATPPPDRDPFLARVLAALAVLLGAVATAVNVGRPRRSWAWPLGCVGIFVLASLAFSPLLPLHEHNSFLARADCATDLGCPDDPAGAVWSTVALDVLGVLFSMLPARLYAYGLVSLAWSAATIAFVYGLVARLGSKLGLGRWSTATASFAALFLALHPLFWRLATSGIFWPYAGACACACGYFGLAATATETPWKSITNSTAAGAFGALACASNPVLLTLVPLVALGPLAWGRWRGARSLGRIVPGVIVFVAAVAQPLREGFDRAFGAPGDAGSSYTPSAVWESLSWIFIEPSLSPLVLVLPIALSLATLRTWTAARAWLPVAYAGLVPFVLLCVHAGDLFGPTYPVQFINHWWSMPFAAIAAGVGLAWLLERLERRNALDRRRLTLGVAGFALVTAGSWPFAHETWRLLHERRVVERELVEIERALPQLPEHDLLVLPRMPLAWLEGAGSEGDPIEVHYPRRIHTAGMRARGLVVPRIVPFDEVSSYASEHRMLVYVGSALRSFEPHEIRGGFVPASLERPELTRLRSEYELEPALELELATAQHELVWARLGADRSPTITVGYYWLHRRSAEADADGSPVDPR